MPSASFDVIGTCFAFSQPISTISKLLTPHLPAPTTAAATSLFFTWFYAAQRDFTYLSLSGNYTPIAEVLRTTFRRAWLTVDLPSDAVRDEDVAAVMDAFKSMGPREGLKECFDGLRDAGWCVLAVTNGGVETSLRYFHAAGVELEKSDLLSCDVLRVAKPDARVYERAVEVLADRGLGGEKDSQGKKEEKWFIAAHAWDLIAARNAGFKTAYLDFEEHDPVTEIFGKFDVYAGSMEELLQKLKEVG